MRSKAQGAGLVRRAVGTMLRKVLERFALGRAETIFNASTFMHARLKATHGLESVLLPLGVDTVKFAPAPDRAAVRRMLNIDADRFVIFTVRNLVTRMGLENLIEAAASVVKSTPEALFIISGRGYLMEKLKALVKKRGVAANIRLTGYITEEELRASYQAADLFVLPTKELEGFGLVTLEALACGTPVLATPVGSNVEVLGAFDKSFLLKHSSSEAIAEGISSFIAEHRGDDALRSRCRGYVEKNCSWAKYAEKVEKALYEASGTGVSVESGKC